MNDERIRGLLGLCQRAGKLKTGVEMVESAVKMGGGKLALMDAGIAPRGRKTIHDACAYANVPFGELREALIAEAIGKPGRMAVCVMDAGFAKKIRELLSETNT